MSPPTDVSGVRSSRDATIDAIVEALGLQIQAMLVERKAVERVLGCDADETVLDAAVRVAEDLANTEKQIDDVRDILKAKVGELTVDAATHAIILAQNHATMVKQVEQLTRELDEARRRLKAEREHSEASDRHLVETHHALGGRSGVEHVTEAARRVVRERDAYLARVKDLESNVCKLSAERDEAKALAVTLAKERDDARALCVAVAAELSALPDEPVLAAAKRVAQDLRDEVDEARQARRDRDKALARTARVVSQTQEAISDLEQKASERATAAILEALGARAGEKAIDVAKRVVKERDDLRDAFQAQRDQARKELEEVRLLLSPKGSWESTADATARVIKERIDAIRDRDRALAALADTSSVVATRIREVLGARSDERTEEAAKRVVMERDAAQASSRRFADVVRGVSATLGAREDEDAVAAAKRVVKERHDLRDELDKRMSL